MTFMRVFQHLLPSARALSTTVDKPLRRLVKGLSAEPAVVQAAANAVLLDTDLSAYEFQFGLPPTLIDADARRGRITAAWANLVGSLSPQYMQDTLRGAGFDVYVHPWWQDAPGRPDGGSVAGGVPPVPRDPSEYLWDGVSPRRYRGAGYDTMYAGGDLAYAGGQVDAPGYALANKVDFSEHVPRGAGHDTMYAGGYNAYAGSREALQVARVYRLSTDPDTFPFYTYVGGETFPDTATVPSNRRAEFEALCLGACPAHEWVGVLVQYN